MKHLVTDLSGHGLGHLAQVAPVISRLASIVPDLHLTIRTSLPEQLVRTWIKIPFHSIEADLDRGMIMRDAITVDVPASCAWYETFHADYEERLKKDRHALETLQPDLLLADVPYIGLEAAHQLGIPTIALCSLNWSDIYRHYCHRHKACEQIADRILSAYAKADIFLQPQPAMPMPKLGNTQQIPPIARTGKASKLQSRPLDKTRNAEKFILLSLGGIGMQFPLETLPLLQNTVWIVPDSFEGNRKDIVRQSGLGMHYIDLLVSVDLVLTKTGYGALVEAVVNQVPVLCIERPGWPEEPGLFDWCKKHGYFEKTTLQELGSPATTETMKSLMNTQWQKEAVVADGDQHAATALSSYLNQV
jgi:hypothetical protein